MYIGSLDPVANNETFEIALQCTTQDTNELVDFTGCLLEFVLNDASGCEVASASTADGGIVLTDPTTAVITIPETTMTAFGADTYQAGLKASLGTHHTSLAIWSLPIVNGQTA